MDDGVVTATEAARNFDKVLDQVAAGHSLTITRDGRPVAVVTRVEGADETAADTHQNLMRLLRQGLPLDFQGGIDREELHRR